MKDASRRGSHPEGWIVKLMDIKEIKNLEAVWQDLNLQVGLEGQQCPLHGGKTFAVTQGEAAIVWRCRNPTCAGNEGGTILKLKVLMGEAGSEVEAAQLLLMDYGKLTEQQAAMAVGAWRTSGAAAPTHDKKGGVASRPRGVKPPDPPEYFLDKYNRRRDAVVETFEVGQATTTESYPLGEANKRWVTSGVYNGKVWSIAVFRWDIETPSGERDKIIRPFTRNPEGIWTYGINGVANRPIYKLHEIESEPNAIIIVVEGEKCMDALQDHLDELEFDGGPRCIVTTSIGGSEAPERSDWSCLKGRRVYLVPDCDGAGVAYVQHIASLLEETSVEAVWVHPAREQGQGFDAADWLKEEKRCGFWELPREPMSWSSTFERLRADCDRAKPHEAQAIIKRIVPMKLDRIIVEDLLGRLSKSCGVAMRVLRSVLQDEQNTAAPRGWGDFFARRVIEEEFNGHLIREADQWWHYDGRKWVRIEFEEQIMSSVDATMRRHWDTDIEDWAGTLKKANFILPAITGSINTRLNLLAPPPPIFNCINTELLIGTNGSITPRKHSAEHYLMHSTECYYDPDASCERYDKMVRTLFCGDEELVRFWHQVVGYLLQPARPFKHFFMLQGSGNNGKTSIIRILSHLAGHAFSFMDVNDLKERFAYSGLPGKLAVIDDDVAAGSKLPDGELKKLSSGVNLSVEYKGKTPVNMHIIATPVLLCNRWPSLSDVTPATLERAITIPFHANIPPEQRDPHLVSHILKHELSGVLNRAIQGFQELLAQGRFIPPPACQRLHSVWLGQSNHGILWANTCLIREEGSTVTAHNVYKDYVAWCDDNAIRESNRYSMIALRSLIEGLSFSTRSTSAKYGRWRIADARCFTPKDDVDDQD